MQLVKSLSVRILTLAAFLGLVLSLSTVTAYAEGKQPKKRIAVVDFENKAQHTQYQLGGLGGGMAEKLIEELINTDKFVVVERQDLTDVLKEQNLDNIANVEPVVVGRLTSAQALIRGTITDVEVTGGGKGGIGTKRFKIGGKKKEITVKVNLRIIDTVTGQIIESRTVKGHAKVRGAFFKINTKDIDSNLEMEDNVSISEAADAAVAEAVSLIVDGMERIQWQGSISRVSGRQLIVNAGLQENVLKGLKLRVFERGTDIIDKDTNESLGRLDEEIGLIEIFQVEPRFSVAKVVQGQGFSAGNIVKPADS